MDSRITLTIFEALDLKYVVRTISGKKLLDNQISTYITLESTIHIYINNT